METPYTLKDTSHFLFFETLDRKVDEIELLLDSEESNEKKFLGQTNKLILDVELHFQKHIIPNSENILNMLDSGYNTIFDHDWSAYGLDKEPVIKKEIERLDRFRKSLKSIIAYLSITESLFDESKKIILDGISEKNDFILSKLNCLFGDNSFSVERILAFNQIKYRDGEGREIAEDLSRRGYVIPIDRYGKSDYVKISVKGAAYIERKNKQKQKTKEKNELDKKIDNIIEHLIKLGYGQEIIFNEIDELRELQHKLSRKSWSQLLKGKLLDLALDRLISTDTANSVYEYLTNNNFRFLT